MLWWGWFHRLAYGCQPTLGKMLGSFGMAISYAPEGGLGDFGWGRLPWGFGAGEGEGGARGGW